MKVLKCFDRLSAAFLVALLGAGLLCAQQRPGTLRGQITDQSGGVIAGVVVKAIDAAGVEKTAATTAEGAYVFNDLQPGRYTVRATMPGFALFEKQAVEIGAGRTQTLDIQLIVTLEKQNVDVTSDVPLGVEAENNAGALVLKGKDLDALPDDPDDLAEALQALAGPSAGPNGGQMFIDGFTGGRLPPKESIREIRINQNPFASEFDRMGMGRIEIFTRAGSDRMRGQSFFNFNDESLNSRNPFAVNRPPLQSRMYGASVGGPLVRGRASFFLSLHRREIDDNAVIHATGLDSALNVVSFNEAVLTPMRSSEIGPRFDLKLSDKHNLTGSYSYEESSARNSGIGELSLSSRAFDRASHEHSLRLTETAILSPRVINETRFQFVREFREQDGDNSIPTLQVLGSFTGGGPQIGRTHNAERRWELQNYTTRASGPHAVKFGIRLRGVRQEDYSPNNFGGSYTFAGGLAPQLDGNNRIVLDTNGQPVQASITSLERYRRTLLFQRQGLSGAEIRALGGGPKQFMIAGGNPLAAVTQVDFGGFAQDDWRVRPNLTFSAGLRYEAQTNIGNNLNFAPRVAFAWSPGAAASRQPKMVIRGGFGFFYDRFSESLTLQARRFDGERQRQYIVSDPTVLDLFPTVPTVDRLAAFAVPQTIRRVAGDLRVPYNMISSISLERQLPKNFTITGIYVRTRSLHLLRTRNINAPLPGTVTPTNRNGVRPLGHSLNVYEYESSGVLDQHQFVFNSFNRMSRRLTLFASYVLGKARSDTDGAGSFPANPYDLSGEYGRSTLDVRSRFHIGGSISLPRGVTLNPFIIARTGMPFNITSGEDSNGDSVFAERPALATDLAKPGVIVTRFGAFDPRPAPGQSMIPRNFGRSPAYFTMNLRLSKTFALGHRPESAAAAAARGQLGEGGRPPGGMMIGGGGGGDRGGGGGGRGGGMRGGPCGGPGGGMFGGPGADSRYSLTFSINASNLLNHTNPGPLVGNLSSPLFGQSLGTAGGFGFGGGGGPNSAAGNRRIDLQMRFSF